MSDRGHVPIYPSPGTRIVAALTAMCRKVGLDKRRVAWRIGPEEIGAVHDIVEAVEENPIATAFLDYLLSTAEREFNAATEEPTE